MADLDELVIKVDTDAKEADSGLDSLASTLESIKEKCKGGAGLASVAKQLSGINSALNTFKAENASKLNAVATALGGLSSLNGVKLSSTIGTQIGEICKSVSGVDDTAAYKIGEIGNAVRGLSGLDNVTISSSIGNQLGSIVDATVALPPDAKDKLQSLSEGLAPFATLGKAQLTTFINQLGKLPDVVEKLDKADMSKFASQMQDVASCMRPLADEMQRVSNGFSAFPERIQRIITENERLSASNARTGRSFGLLKAGASIAVFRKLGHALADCFSESNKYVEDLNLFTVAMGDAADEAFEYANRVREAIGIDPAEWMRNQGVFKQITSGFGVVEDKANLMSKNLTQIGYDISSFYNIGIEEAMQKVQSGIAGELEPLRRLGYALDQATLQQIAYDHGITQSFNTMNQAQKSQLRYIAIMQQSRNVMGDMARTALTPANALRILKQEVTQLARAVGNILVPGLIKIIPVVQAVVQVLAEAAQFIAGLLGFKLPTIDYSGLGAGIGEAAGGAADLEDSLGGAGAAAKELKKTVMGFDELNLLNAPPETGGGGGGGAGGGLGDWDLPLPEYDFLKGLADRADWAKDLAKWIAAIGAGFATWKIGSKALGWFNDLKQGKFSKADKVAAGISLMITGFTLEWIGAYDLGYNGFSWRNAIETAISAAFGVGGSLLVFGTGPLGWTIGIGLALTVGIHGFTVGYNKKQVENEIKNRFGEIQLTAEDCKAMAERLMSGPLMIELDCYVEAKTTVKQAIDNYISSVGELNGLLFKAYAGVEFDKETLLNSADKAIENAKSVLAAQSELYSISLSVGLSAGNVKDEMTAFAAQYFSQSKETLDGLGRDLRKTIDDALADGVLSGDELETIYNLQKEINEITQRAADAEYKAKLKALSLDASDSLTFDSVKQIMEDAQATANERMQQLEGMRLDNLTLAELKFAEDGDKAAYDAAIAQIQADFVNQQAEIQMGPVTWGLDIFKQSFADAFAGAKEEFRTPVEDLISVVYEVWEADETGVLIDGSIGYFMDAVREGFAEGFLTMDVTPETKKSLEQTLAALEPSVEQMQKIADDARAAGVTVPEYVAQGLSDYNMLAAVSGNLDAMDYLLGEKLSTDPNFIAALATAEDAGISINDSVAAGLLNNLQVIENADGTISLINDVIGKKTLEVTPMLVQNLSELGVNLSDGLLNGARSGMDKNKSSWTDWAWLPWNWFAETNEIHSPSKLFERGGTNIIDGLFNGLNRGWNDLVSWWSNLSLPEIHISMPHFTWTSVPIDGLMGQILNSVGLPAAYPSLSVSWYGDGGLPAVGELFVARERGPELVGTMGGHTAVANNDQIVSGIASGVRDANEEQNALLREQNELLRRLLEKDDGGGPDGRQIADYLFTLQRNRERARGF